MAMRIIHLLRVLIYIRHAAPVQSQLSLVCYQQISGVYAYHEYNQVGDTLLSPAFYPQFNTGIPTN